MELNDLVGKKFYVSVIPEIFYWLLPKAKENKFYITRTFTKDVDGVIEPRKNVLRDNVGGIVRYISRQAFTNGIPYYSLEEVAGLFLDEQFFPVWVCNETTFLYNSKSSIMNLAENFEDVFDVDIVDVSEVCEDIMNLKGRMQIVSRRLGVGQRPAHRALNDCY